MPRAMRRRDAKDGLWLEFRVVYAVQSQAARPGDVKLPSLARFYVDNAMQICVRELGVTVAAVAPNLCEAPA